MKNTLTLIFAFLLIGTAVSCKKEGCTDEAANNFDAEAKKDNGACTYDPVMATLTTGSVSSIGVNSASCSGIISNTGSHDVTTVGLCWSTNPTPTIDDEKSAHFYNENTFTSSMGNLAENTIYYVRAYVISGAGTTYGNEQTFSTLLIGIPTLTTTAVNLATTENITTGGDITDNGYGAITERGICWGTSSNPTIADSHTADNDLGIGTYTSYIYGLQSETTYYVRAYATNVAGTAYGQEIVYVNQHVTFIGEYYQGGVVFYIDNTGEHGLICAMTDQSFGTDWGCQVVTGATDLNLDNGEQNTSTIVGLCNAPGIAAVLCSNMNINGYDDWFLPSFHETLYIYYNLNDLNNVIVLNGGDAINIANHYWSSTELDATVAYATIYTNHSVIQGLKTDSKYVRAIRSF